LQEFLWVCQCGLSSDAIIQIGILLLKLFEERPYEDGVTCDEPPDLVDLFRSNFRRGALGTAAAAAETTEGTQ
jgi:hypothetical protein